MTSVPKLASFTRRPLSVYELLNQAHSWRWRGALEWLPEITADGSPVVKEAKVSPWKIHEPRHAPWHRAEAKPRDASTPFITPEASRASLEDRNHGRIDRNNPLV